MLNDIILNNIKINNIMVRKESSNEYNDDIIKQILNNTDTSVDADQTENRADFFKIPIIGLNKSYGIIRDIILTLIGLLIFCGYMYIPNDYTYWNIILIFSSMIILFVASRFVSFIIINLILYILTKLNNISLYYYTILLNGNLTMLIWSISMLVISVLYLPYFDIEIINIYVKNVYDIFICTSIISITNFIRLIIIDYIIEVPSYKQFKIELSEFLSFYYKIHNLFGLLEVYDSKRNKELPKNFTLPFVYKNDAKKNSEELFSLLDKNSSGSITEEELVNMCELLYDNYNNLSHGLVVNRKATRALELIILIIYIFIIIFMIILVLDINIGNLATSLYALLAVWAFALSTSMTRFIESILFITVYHVYDKGDVVKINDDILTVKDIKLYNTHFIGNKGDEVSISNSILSTLKISNLYRSRHSLLEYNLEINNNFLKLNLLKNEIELYLKKPNKWSSDFEMNIKSTSQDLNTTNLNTSNLNTSNIKILIKLKHQLSWKHKTQINASENDFLFELNNIMIRLNIDYKIF